MFVDSITIKHDLTEESGERSKYILKRMRISRCDGVHTLYDITKQFLDGRRIMLVPIKDRYDFL